MMRADSCGNAAEAGEGVAYAETAAHLTARRDYYADLCKSGLAGGRKVAMQSERGKVHLVLILIGSRWVHARGNPSARDMIGVVE